MEQYLHLWTRGAYSRCKDLTQGREGKLIFAFALPMLIGNIFQQLYNTVDSIIVGNTLGKTALAAVGRQFSPGFSPGCAHYWSYHGVNRIDRPVLWRAASTRSKKTIDTTYIFLFVAALVCTLLGLVSSKPLLKLLKTPAEIFPLAQTYLQIIIAGLIFTFGFNTISAVLRGLGNSKTPLYF